MSRPRICTRRGCTTPLREGQAKFCSRRCYKLSGERHRNVNHVIFAIKDQFGSLRDY